MFSAGSGIYLACQGTQDNQITETLKKTLFVDVALTFAISIIAMLGLIGVLPLSIGISFTVLTLLQFVLATILKQAVREKS